MNVNEITLTYLQRNRMRYWKQRRRSKACCMHYVTHYTICSLVLFYV